MDAKNNVTQHVKARLPERMVIISVDTLLDLIKDYCSAEDFPQDAMPITLLINPNEQGKFCVVARSNDWKKDEKPLNVSFKLKRVYSAA